MQRLKILTLLRQGESISYTSSHWPWVIALAVCFVTTRVSHLFKTPGGSNQIDITLAIAIVMALWWGPRVVIGVYLNGFISAAILVIPFDATWFIAGIPQTIAVISGWWLFSRVCPGKFWLPNISNLLRYIGLCIIIPSIAYAISQSLVFRLLSPAFVFQFYQSILQIAFMSIVDGLGLSIPLLVVLSPHLQRRGWIPYVSYIPPERLPQRKFNLLAILELSGLAIGMIAAKLTLPTLYYWYVFGALPLWAALRYGFPIAILSHTVALAIVYYVPAFFYARVAGLNFPYRENLVMYISFFVSGAAALLVGRAISDLTENSQLREQAMTNLIEREERLRSLLFATPDPIFVITPDGVIEDIFASSKRETFFPIENMLGKNIESFLSADMALSARQMIDTVITSHATQEYAYCLLSSSGNRWYLARLASFNSPRGLRILWLDREITHQKRLEEQLVNIVSGVSASTGSAYFNSLVQHLALALYVDFAFIAELSDRNPPTLHSLAFFGDGNFINNFSYTLEEISTQFSPDNLFEIFEDDAKIIHPKNKLLVDFDIRGFAYAQLIGNSGDLLGLLVVMHRQMLPPDNGIKHLLPIFAARAAAELERIKAEIALRDSETKLRSLSEQFPDGVSLIDETGNIIEWNTARQIMTGISRLSAIGNKFWDVYMQTIPPERSTSDRYQQVFDNMMQVLQTGKLPEQYREIQVTPEITPNGEVRMVEEIVFPIPTGRGFMAGTITRDVTARVITENSLRQRAAELELINRVSASMRSANSIEQAVIGLLGELDGMMQTDTCVFCILGESSDRYQYLAKRGWLRRAPDDCFSTGEGMFNRVYASQKPYYTPDFSTDTQTPKRLRPYMLSGWGGILLPVLSQNETLAFFLIALQPQRQMLAEEARLLMTLVEIAGNTIHRLRSYNRNVRGLERLRALHEIDTAISTSLDLRVTLEVILSHLGQLLEVDAADIYLLDSGSGLLELAASRGLRTTRSPRTTYRLESRMIGEALSSRRLVHVHLTEPGTLDPDTLRFFDYEDIRSGLAMALVIKGQAVGVLQVYYRRQFSPNEDWISFFETLTKQAALAVENIRLFENLQRKNIELNLAYNETIEGWSSAMDLRDKETEKHTERVTKACTQLAALLGIQSMDMNSLRHGALLHDLGKIGVPDHILHKNGPLTDEEWAIMRQHPQFAYDILSKIDYLRPALDIPYCHHEWWNGEGYPRGLQGDQIPLTARIFAIVDVWDALRSDRPYRPAWSPDQTRRYIESLSGKQFDPKFVSAFLELLPALESEREK
jgi:PAS domain S-box-containing protein